MGLGLGVQKGAYKVGDVSVDVQRTTMKNMPGGDGDDGRHGRPVRAAHRDRPQGGRHIVPARRARAPSRGAGRYAEGWPGPGRRRSRR
ncbi:MAG: hypothetical protein R3F43_11295 [bacterium]